MLPDHIVFFLSGRARQKKRIYFIFIQIGWQGISLWGRRHRQFLFFAICQSLFRIFRVSQQYYYYYYFCTANAMCARGRLIWETSLSYWQVENGECPDAPRIKTKSNVWSHDDCCAQCLFALPFFCNNYFVVAISLPHTHMPDRRTQTEPTRKKNCNWKNFVRQKWWSRNFIDINHLVCHAEIAVTHTYTHSPQMRATQCVFRPPSRGITWTENNECGMRTMSTNNHFASENVWAFLIEAAKNQIAY